MRKVGLCIMVIILLQQFVGCSDNEFPPIEHPEEIIDYIQLNFVSEMGDTVTISAIDTDAEGPVEMKATDTISLKSNTKYNLEILLIYLLGADTISQEVAREGAEHMVFYEFTEGIFKNPTGYGNVTNRSDSVVYLDFDEFNLPIGLLTAWETDAQKEGFFRVVLKHQPDLKSSESTVNDGVTDVDFVWRIMVN